MNWCFCVPRLTVFDRLSWYALKEELCFLNGVVITGFQLFGLIFSSQQNTSTFEKTAFYFITYLLQFLISMKDKLYSWTISFLKNDTIYQKHFKQVQTMYYIDKSTEKYVTCSRAQSTALTWYILFHGFIICAALYWHC